nr:hypothetical protein [Legionella jordanis]
MLVFGDHDEVFNARERVICIQLALAEARLRRGIHRHSLLVQSLIDAGQLWQALEDNANECIEDIAQISKWTMEIAKAVVHSWNSCFREVIAIRSGPKLSCDLICKARVPEGFLHYALYIEAYLEAAKQLPQGIWHVVGIRSIGTTLAAVVAAVLKSSNLITVRPSGKPYKRKLSPQDIERLPQDAMVAVVDEGPGLSGSTFLAVSQALKDRGCTVFLIPSHPNPPGRAGNINSQAKWESTCRVPADSLAVLEGMGQSERALKQWVEEQVGPVLHFKDVSCGRWRKQFYISDESIIESLDSSLCFMASTDKQKWLVKFCGLGRWGEHRYQLAKRLGEHGWTLETIALVHGFSLISWPDKACAYTGNDSDFPRSKAIVRAAEYLAFRAQYCHPPEGIRGASLQVLWNMVKTNVNIALNSIPKVLLDTESWLTSLEPEVSPSLKTLGCSHMNGSSLKTNA